MTGSGGDRTAGLLLGTALGDALGLPLEGLSARAAQAMLGEEPLRFRLLGRRGFVSDDTEQSALVAQALLRHPESTEAMVRGFRRSLLGWFLRLPWGIGLATLRASFKIALGFRRTGVASAGNGAAMRAAILGVAFPDDADRRRSLGRALAEVTHTDVRAVEGALFVAELAYEAAHAESTANRVELVQRALHVVQEPSLRAAVARALELASTDGASAASELGTSGFVLHTLGFATWCFTAKGGSVLGALRACFEQGGDTDSIGAIVGAWVGALHGAAALPAELLARLNDGPFGPTHLKALAAGVDALASGARPVVPGYSAAVALLRNLALYPVILVHGFRRLIPL